MNAATRLIINTLRSLTVRRHVLHWLDVSDRIKFRLCVTVYEPVHGMAPGYLSELSCADQFLHFKDDVTCVLLVAAILTFLVSDVPLMGNGRLSTLAHLLGTHYLTT